MGSERVAEALQRAEKTFGPVDPGVLAALANDTEAHQRLLALALMRREIARGAEAFDFFQLARALVEDPDNDCRWQAFIVIGESLETRPEEVWSVVRAYGSHQDADMRMAVATVLLEHLLEDHFEEYFPKVRSEGLHGSERFAGTVASCWFDDNDGERFRRVQKLLRNAARGGFERP